MSVQMNNYETPKLVHITVRVKDILFQIKLRNSIFRPYYCMMYAHADKTMKLQPSFILLGELCTCCCRLRYKTPTFNYNCMIYAHSSADENAELQLSVFQLYYCTVLMMCCSILVPIVFSAVLEATGRLLQGWGWCPN